MAAGSKTPEAAREPSAKRSWKSGRSGPRIQAATGMPNPFFGLERISSGTTPRRPRLRMSLVVFQPSFIEAGSRAAYSTTSVSRKGARASSEAAIEARSAFTRMSPSR